MKIYKYENEMQNFIIIKTKYHERNLVLLIDKKWKMIDESSWKFTNLIEIHNKDIKEIDFSKEKNFLVQRILIEVIIQCQ